MNYNQLLFNKRHRFISFCFCFVLKAFQLDIQQTNKHHGFIPFYLCFVLCAFQLVTELKKTVISYLQLKLKFNLIFTVFSCKIAKL